MILGVFLKLKVITSSASSQKNFAFSLRENMKVSLLKQLLLNVQNPAPSVQVHCYRTGLVIWTKANQKLSCLSHQTLVLVFLCRCSHHIRWFLVLTYVPNSDHNVIVAFVTFSVLTQEGIIKEVTMEMNSVNNYFSCYAYQGCYHAQIVKNGNWKWK